MQNLQKPALSSILFTSLLVSSHSPTVAGYKVARALQMVTFAIVREVPPMMATIFLIIFFIFK